MGFLVDALERGRTAISMAKARTSRANAIAVRCQGIDGNQVSHSMPPFWGNWHTITPLRGIFGQVLVC